MLFLAFLQFVETPPTRQRKVRGKERERSEKEEGKDKGDIFENRFLVHLKNI